jgi:hypothetical protein
MSTRQAIFPGQGMAPTVDPDNPWPGLLAFREADQEYFQGRKTETEDLFRLVMRERLTVLFGLSGLGKSSLLQAGLFPMLRRENILPVYIRLDFSSERPDLIDQVKAAIELEALAAQIEAPSAKAGETLWEYFHHRDSDFWNPRNRPVMPILVFDQFEEIFTLGRSTADRTHATELFLDQLTDLAVGRPPAGLKARLDDHPEEARAFSFGRNDYKILLGVREDFLPELEGLHARIPMLALNRLRLGRMNGEAALRVVGQAKHLVEPEVAEQIVRFVAADRSASPLAGLEVEPALLSVVCRELNNKRRKLGEAKITASLLEGSQQQVLTELYENSVADLPNEVRRFVEESLITVSGYRDTEAMENALSTPGVSRESINRLVERRIIRREDHGGVERLELTHDLLTSVVRASRDSRRQIEASQRERIALQQAQEQQKRERDRRDLKRTRIAAILFLLLTVTAIGAAVLAVRSMRRADEARRESDRERTYAVTARMNADEERKKAQRAVEMIQQSLLIRQAALSGDEAGLNKLLSSLDQNSSIRFTAKADDLHYKNSDNDEIYNFGLYPEPGTLPTGASAVAFITYLANHPTFRNTLMTAGPDRQFRASYTGWGCLKRIVALVEYRDPTRPPTVTEFNMCEKLGW